ncbi:MAG: dethiobiotin synthase [Alphaproteobacteria bacterium]|nr:dethiobiotin synthase [Alphaproteobacteria bacterium]
MSTCFITATGTEIGKTFVTTLLCRQLRTQGLTVRVLKPVLSGYEPEQAAESDSGLILEALGKPITEAAVDAITPWRFGAPLSPDMAAAREGREIDFDALVKFCQPGAEDRLLIEGVGGAMVPLTETETVLDWIVSIGAPAIVVAGSYLGTISHTLTTVCAIESRGGVIAGVVVSESAEAPVPLSETVDTIARFLPGLPVVALPRGETEAPDLTKLIPM